MNLCVYKIAFDSSIEYLDEKYEMLSEIEQERISELDAVSYFDYIESDKYHFFVITDPQEIKMYTEILRNNLIGFKISDLSNDILNNKIDLTKELSTKADEDKIKLDFFIEDIKSWILDNLDIDQVLDRISEVGIDNITEIEKNFLKNYKN
jgi:hypothetical protein